VRSLRRVAGVVVAACLLAGSAGGQTTTAPSPSFSDDEVARAVETVRADPNLGGTRTIRTLQWRESKPARPWSWPAWLSWIGDLVGFVAQSGRALFWVGIVALALFLAAYLVRVLSGGKDSLTEGRFIAPTHVRDLDIRPESLPPDIGLAARQLWDRGEHRAALALLYRGLLSRLAHIHQVPIRDSTTEGDCLSLSMQHLDGARHAYITQLVRTWQRAVYGGTEPDDVTVHALCDAFGRTLDQPGATGLTSLDAAEASV
jgi:Domain of unknown function (DUF4129)